MRTKNEATRRIARTLVAIAGAWILVTLGATSASAQVRSDFNGDGIGDLAIGAPNEGIIANRVVGGVVTPTNIVAAGSVTVIYGTASDGLSTAAGAPAPQLIHQEITGVEDLVETNDRFGAAIAAGDFNGDGFDDLAVSVPGDNAIQLFNGSLSGLNLTNDRMIVGTQFVDNQGLALTLQPGLVRGNFNGDAFDDLAIKATEFEGTGVRANLIVMYGSQQFGLQFVGLDVIAFVTAGPAGDNPFAATAMAIAAGDFSNDGADDLAVGLPFADPLAANGSAVLDGGAVTILRGLVTPVQPAQQGNTGITTDGATSLTELSANQVPQIGEHFGAALAVGDFDGDGRDDLAVGTPDEDVVGTSGNLVTDGGFVFVFSRAATLHGLYTQLPLVQNPQAGDHFGATLATGDFNGDGAADLAIGTPDDVINGQAGAGSVTVLFGIPQVGLPRPASQGLPMIQGTVRLFTQSTTDILDDPEAGDRFGATLTTANLGRSAHDDLVIGVPNEDVLVSLGGGLDGIEIENRADAGILHVLYGSATGLQASGSQRWTQNSANVPDAAEVGDRFGGALQ